MVGKSLGPSLRALKASGLERAGIMRPQSHLTGTPDFVATALKARSKAQNIPKPKIGFRVYRV